MNGIRVYEIPSYIICAVCGFHMSVVSDKRTVGKSAYSCGNGSCRQFNQPHWFHYREVVLDDKVTEADDLRLPPIC